MKQGTNAVGLRDALFLALVLVVSGPAMAQSKRAGTSEMYLGPMLTDGKSYTFDGGSTAKTDTGVGLLLGFARNFSPHFQAGMEIAWSDQDYIATVRPGVGNANPAGQLRGSIESRMLRFNGTYHFLAGDFTPFVTGGLGWTYIDTNIPAGLPESFCWYYPWYGSYCGTYVPTQTTTKFSYMMGGGIRLDVGRALFRLMANTQRVDFGGSYGSNSVTQYRIDFGTKF